MKRLQESNGNLNASNSTFESIKSILSHERDTIISDNLSHATMHQHHSQPHNYHSNHYQQHQQQPQRHYENDVNIMSLDTTRHAVALNNSIHIVNGHNSSSDINYSKPMIASSTSSLPLRSPASTQNTGFSTSTNYCCSPISPHHRRDSCATQSTNALSSATALRNSPVFSPYHHPQQQQQQIQHFNGNINLHRTHYDMLPPAQFMSEFKPLHPTMPLPVLPTLHQMLPRSHVMPTYEGTYGYYEPPVPVRPPYALYATSQDITTPLPIENVAVSEIRTPMTEANTTIQMKTDRPLSPIDLTSQHKSESLSEGLVKQRSLLPLPSVKQTYMWDNSSAIPATPATDEDNKPWDLSCSRKRKIEPLSTDDHDDEGISVRDSDSNCDRLATEQNPTPPKVIKLFKPYLLSSDDEDDDASKPKCSENAGKKCLTSDHKQKDPIIWSNHPHYEQTLDQNYAASKSDVVNFQKQSEMMYATSPHRESPQSSALSHHQSPSTMYWLNHGSPVSGYDSASSTFSDCNCTDPVCGRSSTTSSSSRLQIASPTMSYTKLVSPTSTIDTEYHTSTNGHSFEENNPSDASAERKSPSTTIVPHYRRQILEKWSHEEENELPAFEKGKMHRSEVLIAA